MASYKTFALVGVGGLGSFVVNQLLQRQATIKILTRDASKPQLQAFKDRGVTLSQVDYANPEEVQAALTDIDVVVSTVSPYQIDSQLPVIAAAKVAGVKLFVPSEYGIKITENFLANKKVVRETLKAQKLPYALFFTGYFADIVHDYMDYNYGEGYIRVVGEGNTAFSLTSRLDIARFIAHALTVGTAADLEWAELPIEASRKTLLEIKTIAEKKLNISIKVKFVDYKENAAAPETDMVAFLGKAIEDGNVIVGTTDDVKQTIAKFFPDWNPTPMEAFISA